MRRSIPRQRLLCMLLLASAVCGLFAAPASAQDASVADKLSQALDLYNDLDYDKGIAITQELIARPDLTPYDSVAIYEVMSIVTYAKGEQYLQKSIGYLQKISEIGPCLTPLPQEIWPQELRDKWYQILQSKNALSCGSTDPDVKTIAIMQFDNYSTGEYQEKLGLLSKGLADFFAYDFAKISAFKVIERDKIDYILKEIELQKSGAVDKATAVQVGKILGAKYMVFGSITQLDARHTRMVVRVVNVETSEIVALVDKEGRPDYSQMEKDLVGELSEKLDVAIGDDTKELLKQGGTASNDAATLYSQGLAFMDKYDYKQAYEYFKKAYEADQNFVEAKRKMEIYRPLAS